MRTTQDTAQNREGNAKPRGRPFQKGNRANPGGRPKTDPEFLAACNEWTEKTGFSLLQGIAANPKHPKQLDAVKLVIAYAKGQPSQEIKQTGDVRVNFVLSWPGTEAAE